MRGTFADSTGRARIQICLTCETDEERLLLREFIRRGAEPGNRFVIHGCGIDHSGHGGYSSMNFGWRDGWTETKRSYTGPR